MKFKAETEQTLAEQALEREYAQAQNFDKVRLGERCLFYPKLAGVSYLPYEQLQQLYLRQEEAAATMCCGRVDMTVTYLMAVGTDGQTRKTELRDKAAGREVLELVSQRAPQVKIGFR